MFLPLEKSRFLGVSEVVLEGLFVTTGHLLFFFTSFCAQSIPLTVVDEKWYCVAILKYEVENTYVGDFDRYQNYISIPPILLNVLHQYYLRIYELFWDGKRRYSRDYRSEELINSEIILM